MGTPAWTACDEETDKETDEAERSPQHEIMDAVDILRMFTKRNAVPFVVPPKKKVIVVYYSGVRRGDEEA